MHHRRTDVPGFFKVRGRTAAPPCKDTKCGARRAFPSRAAVPREQRGAGAAGHCPAVPGKPRGLRLEKRKGPAEAGPVLSSPQGYSGCSLAPRSERRLRNTRFRYHPGRHNASGGVMFPSEQGHLVGLWADTCAASRVNDPPTAIAENAGLPSMLLDEHPVGLGAALKVKIACHVSAWTAAPDTRSTAAARAADSKDGVTVGCEIRHRGLHQEGQTGGIHADRAAPAQRASDRG